MSGTVASSPEAPLPPPPPPPSYEPPRSYLPPASSARPPGEAIRLPPWLDLGIIVIGLGALLLFIGFIVGAFAITNLPTSSSAGSVSGYEGGLETFFVLSGIGILLVLGGWCYRILMTARRGRP